MIHKRSSVLLLLCFMFAVSVAILFGRRHEPSPIEKVFKRTSTRNENTLVKSLSLSINEVDIGTGRVTVKSGSRAALTGHVELSSLDSNGQITMVMVIIALRKKGSPESAWRDSDLSLEWVGPGKPKLEFGAYVTQPPGEYDFRVYILNHIVGAEFPKIDYVTAGSLAITE